MQWRRFAGSVLPIGLALAGLLISGGLLAQDCPLTSQLIVKDTQSGVVGPTGTVWAIEPDCSFTVARQIGLKTAAPHRQGRLTSEQQARLGELLHHLNSSALPEHIGSAVRANPRQIALSYDGRVSVLTLAPGGGALEAIAGAIGDDPAARVLQLAIAVKGMTGG